MNIKEILAALNILKSAPDGAVAAILADGSLEKAAQDLTAAENVADRWQTGETNGRAKREDIKVGPELHSSGNGATEAVREYSNPAPQNGTMITAESLAHLIAPIAASSKATNDALKVMIENMKATNLAITALTAKAKGADEDMEDEDEDDEIEEMKSSTAKSLVTTSALVNRQLVKSILAYATDYIARAEKANEDLACATDTKERKVYRTKARKAAKTATALLSKAASVASLAGLKDLRKSVLAIAAKADMDIEEDDGEDEEDAKKPEMKAKEPAKGNQDDKADAATHNQSDSAAKALNDMSGKIDAALKGFGMLQTDVNGLMQTLMNTSRTGNGVPEFTKSGGVDVSLELAGKIEDLEESGQMSASDALAARDILGKSAMVRLGQIPASAVSDRLAKSSVVVQGLFRDHKAA